jgi:predicted O-methyltransferase YrrM
MKYQDTSFWKNYSQFTKIVNGCTMRSTVDGYVYYKLITEFNFKNFLEIGFFEGQTAGLLAELSTTDAKITCIDPNPNTDIFNQTMSDQLEKITLLQIPSQQFNFSQVYDFIIVDGDKSYNMVSQDISNSLKSIDPAGLLLINEYQQHDVVQALHDCIDGTDWVPIIRTNQSLIFHHCSQDRSDFLDYKISDIANNFINFVNIDINGHVVLDIQTLPIFTDFPEYFDLALKQYSI